MILSNIRYAKNADHYWSFEDVILEGIETLVGLPDKGFPSTIAIQAFRSFGKDASFYPLDVEHEAIRGVRIVRDSVSDKALEFDSSKASCIKLADFKNPAILPMNFFNKCLRDPSSCYFGFSVGIWVKFPTGALKGGQRTLLLASGPGAGFTFYQEGRVTHVEVRGGKKTWKAEAADPNLSENLWANVGFLWSRSMGVNVCIIFRSFHRSISIYIFI